MHLKVLLFFPTLSCRKKIGPLELNFISNAITINNGNPIIKENKANKKSNRVLKLL
tara:strand:+ start:229 stop:396 length:168 start_codon:yes stop_codon:yes gene_type:complete